MSTVEHRGGKVVRKFTHGLGVCFCLAVFDPTLAQSPETDPSRLSVAQLADAVDEHRNSDPARAVSYANLALEKLELEPNPNLEVRVLNELCWALRLLGQPQDALQVGQRSLQLAIENNDKPGQGRALNNIGIVYWYMGDHETVLDYWLKALKVREEVGDPNGIAGSLNNIGLVYFDMGDNQMALEQFQRALEISTETGNEEYLVGHLDNLGEVRARIGDTDQAYVDHMMALGIAQRIGNRKGEVAIVINLGHLFAQTGDLALAEKYLRDGYDLATEIGVSSKRVEAASKLVSVLLESGRPTEALTIAMPTLDIADSLTEKAQQRDLYQLLSDIYVALGDNQRALDSYKQFSEINVEMLKQQRDDKLTLLQIGFETDANEKQIQLLQQAAAIQELDLARADSARRTMWLGIAFLVALLAVVAVGYRTKMRSNRMIRSQLAELQATRRELQRLAVTDPLTKLFNRRAMQTEIDRLAKETDQGGASFVLAIMDLDKFKAVNDEHGHEVGDHVLIVAAERIQSAVREQDIVARWGGEEFLILIPESDTMHASTIVEAVQQSLASKPMDIRGVTLSISATVGMAAYDHTSTSIRQVIRDADKALYHGKRQGGRCVIVAGLEQAMDHQSIN